MDLWAYVVRKEEKYKAMRIITNRQCVKYIFNH